MAQLAFSFDLFDESPTSQSAPPVAKLLLIAAIEQAVTPTPAVWQPLARAQARPTANPIVFRVRDRLLAGRATVEAKFEANMAAIELLDKLEADARSASEEEREILARYAGWGAVPQAFAAEAAEGWTDKASRLAALLGDRLKAARASTPNAHFTPLPVVDAIWSAVQRLGFAAGRILEPAAGIGHFLGRMPDALRATSQVTAVELEPITGTMLRHLYPEADVRIEGFEQFHAPKGAFDLAIGNVPFGDYRLHDPAYDHFKLRIHDYFIMKCCQQVRQGGLVALITSTATMDGSRSKVLRRFLTDYTEIVSAVRLPNGLFAESANTEVATDLLLLKVTRSPNSQPDILDHTTACELSDNLSSNLGGANRYWLLHPENVMGQWARLRGQYRELLGVTRTERFAEQLAEVIASLPAGIMTPRQNKAAPASLHFDCATEGELRLSEAGILRRFSGGLWQPLPARERGKVSTLFSVSGILQRLLNTQNTKEADEHHLAQLRDQLNASYDEFVGEYGPVSRRANVLAIKNWSMLPLLLSLEHWDERNQTATKAAIFSVRTTRPPERPTSADSLESALMIAFGEALKVDLPRIADLLSMSGTEAGQALEAAGLAFFDPVEGHHVIAEEYLSGDVREKRRQIEPFAKRDARYQANRDGLDRVMPTDLTAKEISIQLGAPWIPLQVISKFVRELTADDRAKVSRSAALARWEVSAWSAPAAKVQWGHTAFDVGSLIEFGLNGKRPTVYFVGDPPQVNHVETAAARDKMARIQEHFKIWVWQDESRQHELEALYNRRFNAVVPRKYDGRFLTFPDKSAQVELRDSQREAIARSLIAGPTGVFHKTGAGKTMILCAIAHEARRLGLVRKSVIVVQNSTLYQFAAEYVRLYPGARILVPDREELSGNRRKAMIAKIATGDWEAVIVAHSSLERLTLGEGAVDAVRTYLCEPLDIEIAGAQTQDVKRLETQRKRIDELLAKLLNRKGADDHLKFEDLAVDNLLVDEAHRFKNLWYFSGRPRVAGLQQAASKRALDLLAKAIWLYQRHDRPYGLTLATATPITNTIAEIYTMQRFLQPHVLREQGLEHFDAWASMFGEVVSSVEVTPTGRGFRVHERFARFHNVPELMRIYLQCADIRNKSHLSKILREPEIAGGKPTLVAAKCHPIQGEYISTLVERAEAIRRKAVDPSTDNMLKVVHDGRMVALDMRLMLPDAPDWEGSKVNLAVERIFHHWQEGGEQRTTQLVFSDLSVPQKNGAWSIYEDIRAKLVALGIPDDEIAFAQYAETDRARAMLFQQIRDGQVRIALGSTERLGTGANVQDRLIAMHHLDVPWRPSDLEQRDGRGIRNGNMHEEVFIYRYVTEQSFDAYMWQTAETKAKFILQVMDPEMKLRTVDDIATATLSYAEVKAAASGDPTVIEKISIDAELARLNLLSIADQSRRREFQWRAGSAARGQVGCEVAARRLRAWLDVYAYAPPPTEVVLTCTGDRYPVAAVPDGALQTAFHLSRIHEKSNGRSSRTLAMLGELELRWSANSGFAVGVPKEGDTTAISFPVGFAETAVGFKRLVDHIAPSAEKEIAAMQIEAQRHAATTAQIAVQLAKPWDYQEQFDALRTRSAELEKLLELNANEHTAGLNESTGNEEAQECEVEVGVA